MVKNPIEDEFEKEKKSYSTTLNVIWTILLGVVLVTFIVISFIRGVGEGLDELVDRGLPDFDLRQGLGVSTGWDYWEEDIKGVTYIVGTNLIDEDKIKGYEGHTIIFSKELDKASNYLLYVSDGELKVSEEIVDLDYGTLDLERDLSDREEILKSFQIMLIVWGLISLSILIILTMLMQFMFMKIFNFIDKKRLGSGEEFRLIVSSYPVILLFILAMFVIGISLSVTLKIAFVLLMSMTFIRFFLVKEFSGIEGEGYDKKIAKYFVSKRKKK